MCDPASLTNDEASSHLATVDCTGVTTHGATCAVNRSAGFAAGSVTCDPSTTPNYLVVAAVAVS